MSVLFQLFITFFQIGITSFGGGYAMMPLVQAYTLQKGWLTVAEVSDMVAISEMTPGPFAINIATFTGFKIAGLAGGLAATLGVVAPSFIIIVAIAKVFQNAIQNKNIQGVLLGIRPVVVGLIAFAAYSIGASSFVGVSGVNITAVLISVLVFVGIVKYKISPILLICLAGIFGILLYAVFSVSL